MWPPPPPPPLKARVVLSQVRRTGSGQITAKGCSGCSDLPGVN